VIRQAELSRELPKCNNLKILEDPMVMALKALEVFMPEVFVR
jgi:hypothetical protein